jgi:hypothetical protein
MLIIVSHGLTRAVALPAKRNCLRYTVESRSTHAVRVKHLTQRGPHLIGHCLTGRLDRWSYATTAESIDDTPPALFGALPRLPEPEPCPCQEC